MARFRFDPDRSAVVIEATSSVHPITTRTAGLEGFVDVEVAPDGEIALPDAGVSGEVSLAVSRLSSGNPLQDRELRRRIDARRFPTIDGHITAMQETETEGRYRVRGDLSFRGVTREHEDDVTFTRVDERTLRLEGRSTFDIRNFGMEPPRILVLRVHPEVTVTLEAIAVREE